MPSVLCKKCGISMAARYCACFWRTTLGNVVFSVSHFASIEVVFHCHRIQIALAGMLVRNAGMIIICT